MNDTDIYDILSWMTNSTMVDDYSETPTPTEKITRTVVPVVLGVIAVLGFVGNLSVIVVVAANLRMRTSANALIASLAVVDLLVCLLCIPTVVVVHATKWWPFSKAWCKVRSILVVAVPSNYTLTCRTNNTDFS